MSVSLENMRGLRKNLKRKILASDHNQREMTKIKNRMQKKLTQVVQKMTKRPKTYVKEEKNELDHEKQPNSTYGSNLELSEEFIIFILRQVDDLCENIKNCDPDIERALGVNQNLSNSVSCYKDKLNLEPHFLTEFEHEEQCIIDDVKQETSDKLLKYDSKALDNYSNTPKKKIKKKKQLGFEKLLKNDSKYIDSSSEAPKTKIKKERKNEAISDETWEEIKNQCGRHTASSLALFLGIAKSTIYDRIQKEKITFPKKEGHCDFCELKKNTENVFDDQLLPFLTFNSEKDEFGCALCNYHGRYRKTLLKHIKIAHRNNIGANRTKDTKLEENLDCGKSMCFKLYGENAGRKFWCTKCDEDFKKNPISMIQKPKYIPKMKVCPECGISTINLGRVSEIMGCKELTIFSKCCIYPP